MQSVVIYRLVRRALPSLILLISISCGSLFFRLGSLPLSGADEPRYARIAQEMGAQGSWVTPLLEGKPWLEKPPLYYWLTIPFYSIFGVNETAARLGPAICALIIALTVFRLGSVLWSGTAGLLGASILLTSLGFVGFGRSASTDMPFTCFFTLAMALFAARERRPPGSAGLPPAGIRRPRSLVLFAYLFLGLAVLGKGPVAIILAAGIGLCVWFLDDRGVVLHDWRVLPGIVLTAAVSVPWFWLAFRENGFGFISTFFINHNLARYITDIHHHSQPAFYYLPVLPALLLPWSGWLLLTVSKAPLAAIRRWRSWEPSMVFLSCWFFFPVVFFSLSDSKLAGYILPSLPPMALILGVRISRAIEGSIEKSRMRAASVLQLVLSTVMAAAIPVFFNREYGGNWQTGLLLSAAVLAPALFSFASGLRGRWLQAFGATVVQGLIFIVMLAQFAFPLLGAYHSTREIATRALEMRRSGEPIVTYRFFHHSLHYYTGYQVAGKLDDRESLVQYAKTHPRLLVVTNVQGTKEISGMSRLAASPLWEQGNFRLLRVSTTDSTDFTDSTKKSVKPVVKSAVTRR